MDLKGLANTTSVINKNNFIEQYGSQHKCFYTVKNAMFFNSLIQITVSNTATQIEAWFPWKVEASIIKNTKKKKSLLGMNQGFQTTRKS